MIAIMGVMWLAGSVEVVYAKFRGTDILAMNTPGFSFATGSQGLFYNVHPWSAYGLDAFVSKRGIAGIDSFEGNMYAFFTKMLWTINLLFARLTLLLFEFSFTFDAISGSNGLMATVGESVKNVYQSAAVRDLMQVGIVIGCGWMVVQIARQQFALTVQGFGKMLAGIMIGFAVISYPQKTIGVIFSESNRLAAEVLEAGEYSKLTGNQTQKLDQLSPSQRGVMGAADGLFRVMVDSPWQVLQFGGMSHCAVVVRKEDVREDSDVPGGFDDVKQVGVPADCGPRAVKLAFMKTRLPVIGPISHQTYAKLMLSRQDDERKNVYEAIKDGQSSEESKDAGAKQPLPDFTAADMPAADMMQEQGQLYRPALTFFVLFGNLGAFFLMSGISLSITVAQIMAMMLFCLAPGAAFFGVIPTAGAQRIFATWLGKLFVFLVRKLVYAFVLVAVLLVQSGMIRGLRFDSAQPRFGWFIAFIIQSLVFWGVLIKHRAIMNTAKRAITGNDSSSRRGQLGHLLAQGYYAGRIADTVNSRAVAPLVGGVAGVGGFLLGRMKNEQRDRNNVVNEVFLGNDTQERPSQDEKEDGKYTHRPNPKTGQGHTETSEGASGNQKVPAGGSRVFDAFPEREDYFGTSQHHEETDDDRLDQYLGKSGGDRQYHHEDHRDTSERSLPERERKDSNRFTQPDGTKKNDTADKPEDQTHRNDPRPLHADVVPVTDSAAGEETRQPLKRLYGDAQVVLPSSENMGKKETPHASQDDDDTKKEETDRDQLHHDLNDRSRGENKNEGQGDMV